MDPGSEEGPFRASQERQSAEPGQAVEEHARAEKTAEHVEMWENGSCH